MARTTWSPPRILPSPTDPLANLISFVRFCCALRSLRRRPATLKPADPLSPCPTLFLFPSFQPNPQEHSCPSILPTAKLILLATQQPPISLFLPAYIPSNPYTTATLHRRSKKIFPILPPKDHPTRHQLDFPIPQELCKQLPARVIALVILYIDTAHPS